MLAEHANFVDRVDDLAELHRVAESLSRREGAAVVVEGRSGIGKTALLDRFVADPGGQGTRAGAYRVLRTSCRPMIGEGLAFGPVIEILIGLQRRTSRRSGVGRLLRSAGRGALQASPDALASLVPGLAPVLTMARAVAESTLGAGSLQLDSLEPYKRAVALQMAERITELVRSGPPTVLVVDDVQFIDEDSLQVLDFLVRHLVAEPLMLVLGLTTPSAPGRPAGAVFETVALWSKDRLVRRRPLGALSASWVAELVGLLEVPAPPGFAVRLTEATGGLPMFVTLCLEHWRPQDGARIVLPESVAEIVDGQLALLDESDRRMLVLAAVQGPVFVTSLLAQVMARPHDEVMERLRLLAQPRSLLREVSEAERPEWTLDQEADVYTFDHLLLWDAVYQAQTDEQRRSRHEQLARVMLRDLAAYDEAPLGLRLELARQLELGGRPCLRESAELRMALARSAAADGVSFAAAEMHCAAAVAALRRLRRDTRDTEVARRFVEAAEMLLSMTEVRWRGQHAAVGSPANIDGLAEEAERMAAETGDPDLVARSALQRGKTLLATRGLSEGLDKLAEAVELAKRLEDPTRLYVATVEFGRQVSKRNLADGLAALREAERMYESDPRLRRSGQPVLGSTRNLAEMQLAVTLFDSGFLEDALERLERCVDRLRRETLNAELPIALNYLAQVQLALGQSTQAASTLREALEFEERRGGESGWHAYNAALLALALSADESRAEESVELAEGAWSETQATWLLNLVPIVRNLLAEVLLSRSAALPVEAGRKLLERVDKLAEDTCVETLESGMTRSRIAALDLRARAHLRKGASTRAADFARSAVAVLDEVGEMPALRTEEVLYHAACVLRADGDEAEAAVLLDRARQVVERKAHSIESEPLRRAFTQDVPLNRWISSGFLDAPER
jgi:tetratricopeptide (TPR) repeat protein